MYRIDVREFIQCCYEESLETSFSELKRLTKKEIERQAEEGNCLAQYLLATVLEEEIIPRRDAYNWYVKAAKAYRSSVYVRLLARTNRRKW